MTHSPLIIGFASIIPGLGFWLLGQRQRSVVVGTIVLGLLSISLIFFGKPIGQFFAQFFQLAWLAQLVFAIHIARTNQKQLKGEIQAPQPTTQFHKPTKNLSGTQASDYFSREISKGQLQDGERIIKSLIGKGHVSASATALAGVIPYFAASWYCITLTQSNLLVIELDFLMKPAGVQRFLYAEVEQASFAKDWLNKGKLQLDFGKGKVLVLDVTSSFVKQAQAIVSVFSKPQSSVRLGGG